MGKLLMTVVVAAGLVATAAAQSKPVYQIGKDGVKAPVLIYEVKPNYTQNAKDRKVQGTVELKAVVQSDGTLAEDIQVVTSLDPDLDQQAINALRRWRFRPGTKDDHAVDVEVNIEMTFTLK